MNITLFPTHETDLPEGMIHDSGTPCPFEPYGHPRGDTCCSLDATAAQAACLKYCPLTLAVRGHHDLSSDAAEMVGYALRDSFVNLMAFHAAYAAKTVNPLHPMVAAYDEARARGEEYPDWPFDRFAAAVMPIGQASDWLVQVGRSRHGVRFAG